MKKQLLLVVACTTTTVYAAEVLSIKAQQDLLNAVETSKYLVEQASLVKAQQALQELQRRYSDDAVAEHTKKKQEHRAAVQAWMKNTFPTTSLPKAATMRNFSFWSNVKYMEDVAALISHLEEVGTSKANIATVLERLLQAIGFIDGDPVAGVAVKQIAYHETLEQRWEFGAGVIQRGKGNLAYVADLPEELDSIYTSSVNGIYMPSVSDNEASIKGFLQIKINKLRGTAAQPFDGPDVPKGSGNVLLERLVPYAVEKVSKGMKPNEAAARLFATDKDSDWTIARIFAKGRLLMMRADGDSKIMNKLFTAILEYALFNGLAVKKQANFFAAGEAIGHNVLPVFAQASELINPTFKLNFYNKGGVHYPLIDKIKELAGE